LKLLALAVLVASALVSGAAVGATNDGKPRTTSALDLVVQRPAGPAVELRFEVATADAATAAEAARAAVARLVPGGTVADPAPGVTAQWAQWGWAWSDAELPVPVAYNPAGAPDFVAPDSITNALAAWSSAPGSRFTFRYAGITDRNASLSAAGPDGENVIAWQALDCTTACVLAVTTREVTHESDLILNSNPAAGLGNGGLDANIVDTKTVILHETGHMAGLEHSCPPLGPCTPDEANAVMYFAYRGVKRALTADDIAGISAIYPARGGQAGQPVSLEPGWNLVTLPAGALGDTMAGLRCGAAVYAFEDGTWHVWIRDGLGALNTLIEARAGRAYWVQADAACARTFAPP
jgi:hypothetical protein